MKVIKSQKGGDQICYEGYVYRKNTTNNETQNWRCIIKGCKGTATTPVDYSDTSDVVLGQNHSHALDMPKEKVTIALSMLRNEASGSTAPPRRIIAKITQDIDCETSSRMPKRKALTKCIQRKRQKAEGYYP